jgi:tetratricopeptide (TPR) repeat protein
MESPMHILKSQNRLKFSLKPLTAVPNFNSSLFYGLVSLVLVGLYQPSIAAQDDLFLVFGSVKMDDTNKRILGVKVVVYQDGSVFDELFTDAKGDYDFELPLRHDYAFSFEMDGHSNKRIEVDASGIPESALGNRNMDLDMTMFPLPPGFDESIFNNAYGRGEYNDAKNTVVFDSNYTVRMRNKVQAEFARLERMEGELERMQDDFDAFLKKGDQSMGKQEWQQAVDFYDSALALFPEESNALSKRSSAQVKLDEFLASGQSETAFLALLDEGEQALIADQLDEAIEAFEAAAVMRPDAPEPANGLRDVEARREAKEQDGEYDEVIAEADNYFDREQYERAISAYDNASRLKPAERYPRNRKEEAQTRIDDLASESASIIERTMAYEALIDEANDLYRDDDYASALLKYEEASRLLPAERMPQQRAQECRERIAEAESDDAERLRREEERAQREASSASLRELQVQYDAINDDADILFRNDDYAAAIIKYNEALEVLPDERYPVQRMTEAQRRIDEALAKAEARSSSKDKDRKKSEKDDQDDRASKQKAADVREARDARQAEEAAQDELDRKARESQNLEASAASDEAALLDAEFDRLIASADAAYDAADWDSASRSYSEALEVKPDDRYASGRLVRIAKNRDSLEPLDTTDDLEAQRAALKAERAAADLESNRADASADQSDEAERQRRLDAERERSDQLTAERLRKDDQARNRAQELASAMNSQESDEVELYYQEALKSEERSRQLDVENKKLAAAELQRQSARAANVRIEGNLVELSALERGQKALVQDAVNAQSRRVDSLNEQVAGYKRTAGQSAQNGREQQEQGEQKAQGQKENSSRLKRNRSRDYASAVPDLEQRKRNWRNLFRGVNRAAADRRSVNAEKADDKTRQYREVGSGADLRAQERYVEVRRKERQVSRRLSERKTEADRRAYDSRMDGLEKVSTASNDKGSYVLSEDDQEVLMGIHEESYDIPNGLVIERTVRTGNLVVRYRKVVTKTGIYYFKGDRSITVDTWKRETSIVLD